MTEAELLSDVKMRQHWEWEAWKETKKDLEEAVATAKHAKAAAKQAVAAA